MIHAYVGGIFPQSERLIEASRRRVPNLREMVSSEETRLVTECNEAGLTLISDPLLDWSDLFRPFTEGLAGVEVGPLDRFFENNTFYRKPRIVGRISKKDGILSRKLHVQCLPRKAVWKVDVPDPYTFAQLSLNLYYRDRNELTFDFARILRRELQELSALGFKAVQFNAPSIAALPPGEELETARRAIREATEGLGYTSILQVYFEDVGSILRELDDFNVDILGIDLLSTKLDGLDRSSMRSILSCGVFDSRNTRMERPEYSASLAERASRLLNPKGLAISASCDLEFIPQPFALRKIRRIGKARRLLEEMGL